MKVTVREISISSKPECTFYLKLEWARDLGAGFVIQLCDGLSAWSGEGIILPISHQLPQHNFVPHIKHIILCVVISVRGGCEQGGPGDGDGEREVC